MRFIQPGSKVISAPTIIAGVREGTLERPDRAALRSRRSLGRIGLAGANITLKVDSDADSFFLRLYREKGRTRTEIDAEIGALLAFRPAGQTHVSMPVQLRDKRFSFLCPLMHT
jgi:Ser/Thr protein kinase RdoA (MazF antagonist)